MRNQTQGFTLIELMIVVAIIAIIASIAIPNLLSARENANESAAIATLKNICSAQAQLQSSGLIDVNANGAGEYGFFGELSGAVGIRTAAATLSATKLRPAALSTAFGRVTGSCVVRSGYLFQMYLPQANATAEAEDATGGYTAGNVDAARAETLWCCYAWPVAQGASGRRAFFVNQAGDLLSCTDSTLNGTIAPIAPTAAFRSGTSGTMDCPVAANTLGVNGRMWTVVN